MKGNIINNLFLIILYIIILSLICLMIFFGVYIYNKDYKKSEKEIVEVSEMRRENVITTILPEQDEIKNVIKIEPLEESQVKIQNNVVGNIDKFYYNQLDKYSKSIYDTLNNNKELLKTGTAKIDLQEEIKELLKTEEGASKIEGIFNIAINAFEYDNPDIFYIDASKMVLYYETSSSGNCNAYIKNDDGTNSYLIEEFNGKEDIDRNTKQIGEIVQELKNNTDNLNNYEKIKYIHDWIVKSTKYDETLNRSNKNNIYGLLVEKDATCGGYAKTFKYIMDNLNINSIIIQGKAKNENTSEYHAWNYVQLDNTWYGIDCTWDDPIVIGINEEEKQIYYNYFLKGQASFDNHVKFDTFYGTDLKINYPELSVKDY